MATINVTLAAGSVASPYYFDVKITKQLCSKTPNAPVFSPVFTLVNYAQVGTSDSGVEYEAIINVQGIVTYTPCGCCCAKSQTVNQQFVIPFYSATAPSGVSIASGTPINVLVKGTGCKNCCSNTFVCDVPLNLTIVTA